MVTAPRTINVDPTSELGQAQSTAEETPVLLAGNGRVCRVSPAEQDDPWAGYDPERVRSALRRFAGTLTPEEGERLKELIHRGRAEGTRPFDRP